MAGYEMEQKYILFDTKRVKSFKVDEKYSSRMLLDDEMVGRRTVQINEGTVEPGARLGGGVHEDDEIYYILSGDGILIIGDAEEKVEAGYLVFIPAGTFHALYNTNNEKKMELLTFWREPSSNDVYEKRMNEWGSAFVLEES